MDTVKADWTQWMPAEGRLLAYVTGEGTTHMIVSVCTHSGELPFDPDGDGGGARAGVRPRSNWKAAVYPQCSSYGEPGPAGVKRARLPSSWLSTPVHTPRAVP